MCDVHHSDPEELARVASAAIDAVGVNRLAKHCGVTRWAVFQWRRQIPQGRLEKVAAISGIPAERLRPDLARLFRSEAA
jgi:transposase-like protein